MFTFYELNLNEENQTQGQDTLNTDISFYILYIYLAISGSIHGTKCRLMCSDIQMRILINLKQAYFKLW